MKIHEYQAKDLLESYGIPVPEGYLALDSQSAFRGAKCLGGTCVVKAMIHSGGRGKGRSKISSFQVDEARDTLIKCWK